MYIIKKRLKLFLSYFKIMSFPVQETTDLNSAFDLWFSFKFLKYSSNQLIGIWRRMKVGRSSRLYYRYWPLQLFPCLLGMLHCKMRWQGKNFFLGTQISKVGTSINQSWMELYIGLIVYCTWTKYTYPVTAHKRKGRLMRVSHGGIAVWVCCQLWFAVIKFLRTAINFKTKVRHVFLICKTGLL